MKLKNYDELIPQIARMMLDHDRAHTGYQEDIYLYVDADGNGSLKLFPNVGGNSCIDDDHYTVCSLPELFTDWMATFPDFESVADALDCPVATLRHRVAAWVSETTGWYRSSANIQLNEMWHFIEEHPQLRNTIYDAEEQQFEDMFSDYVDAATEIFDDLLQGVE